MQKIKTGVLSRTFSVAKLALGSGAQVGKAYLSSKIGQGNFDSLTLKSIFEAEAIKYVKEFDQLKGAIMKIGQMISLYEGILPKEIVVLFKKLRCDSEPVAWQEMVKVINRNLSKELREELLIDQQPIAAASIGQVYLATRKSDGRKICLKVQYPKIDQSVDSDIAALRKLLSIFNLVPKHEGFDQVIEEIRVSLKAEMDYKKELVMMEKMRGLVGDSECFIVPETFPEYSSKRILATAYHPGLMFDSPEMADVSLTRRQILADHMAQLFLQEIFDWHLFQSDPHFGNYIVQLDPKGKRDKIVLIDFGATSTLSKNVVSGLRRMIVPFLLDDKAGIIASLEEIGALYPKDSQQLKERYADAVLQFREMMRQKPTKTSSFLYEKNGYYRWENTDIVERSKDVVFKLSFDLGLRPPPRDFLFLGRKGIGVFMMMRTLSARIDIVDLMMRHMPEEERILTAVAKMGEHK